MMRHGTKKILNWKRLRNQDSAYGTEQKKIFRYERKIRYCGTFSENEGERLWRARIFTIYVPTG